MIVIANERDCSRNNGYAISTPSREQYQGDGIGEKQPSVVTIL